VRLYERALTQAEIQSLMVGPPPVTSPRIVAVELNGSNLIFNGTNGVPGTLYYVLTSTNLALPISSWMRAATNQFGPDGSFAFTNAVILGAPQEFYLLQLAP
jgi:hypothetical protein